MVNEKLKKLTGHDNVKIVSRGDTAIKTALKKFNKVLIPSEGGWLSYKKLAKSFDLVKCNNSKIVLEDLNNKVSSGEFDVLIYQNPGGYFAEQPMEEIYQICKGKCKVIIDVSGAIGTSLCDGKFADILVGSFGKWKLVDLGKGGFISCRDKAMFEKLDVKDVELSGLNEKLGKLDSRINLLVEKRKKIIRDFKNFKVLYPNDLGFVVVVVFSSEEEREKIIKYCTDNNLEFTECPRYIRVNRKAISVEVKRL
jgi:hypothetical protein